MDEWFILGMTASLDYVGEARAFWCKKDFFFQLSSLGDDMLRGRELKCKSVGFPLSLEQLYQVVSSR